MSIIYELTLKYSNTILMLSFYDPENVEKSKVVVDSEVIEIAENLAEPLKDYFEKDKLKIMIMYEKILIESEKELNDIKKQIKALSFECI